MKRIIDEDFIAMLEGHDLSIQNLMNGLFGGNRRSQAYGSSAEFADYRAYAAGDELKRVDWNLYARFKKLYLKLFVDERQLHHRVYFDTSASMDWGTPSKAYAALRIGAALGFLAVQAMDRVTFYGVSGEICQDLSGTVMGKDAFYSAVESLETLAFKGTSELGKAINNTHESGAIGGISVLISDFLTDSDWKEAVDLMIQKRREVYLIQVLSRDEITPEISGKYTLRDLENREPDYRSDFSKEGLRAYRDAVAYHQGELQSFCASRGVGFFSVCTDEPLEKMLFDKAVAAEVIQ